jgi:hypothetical protein
MAKKREEEKDDIEIIPTENEEEEIGTSTITDEDIAEHMKRVKEEREMRKRIRATPLGDKNLMDFGRLQGQIVTTSPHVLQIIKEEAARTGKKEYEVLRDWIMNYAIIRYDTWNKMSVAELYEAWLILNEFQSRAVENFGKFAKIMFSTQMQTFTDIIEEATKRKGGYSPEAKERMAQKIIDAFEPMMDIFSKLMTTSLTKAMGINTPQQKIKIPVEIQEETEE